MGLLSATRDIVVVGASAGGVEALKSMAHDLPEDLPACVFVVLHLPPEGRSLLPEILSRAGPLPARHARDGERFEPGTLYVGPPDQHLELDVETIRLSRGPRENGYRPAVDRLFTTAAHVHRERVTGVILSGALDDGTVGLSNVVALGGAAIIQDPDEALYPGMPSNAAAYVPDAHILLLEAIAPAIAALATSPVPLPARPRHTAGAAEPMLSDATGGTVSGLTCPECSGALWETEDKGILRFRCRVGHAYTVESLVAAQGASLEAALWTALRALEERVAFVERLRRRFTVNGRHTTAARYEAQAEEARQQADVVRRALGELMPTAPAVTVAERQ